MLLEGFAQPVQSKGVYARIAESQNPGENGDKKMNGGGVHVGLIGEGVVEIQEVIRQPAESKQSHEHQDGFGNSLPGFDLRGRGRRGEN